MVAIYLSFMLFVCSVACLLGYITNVVKLLLNDCDDSNAIKVLRIVGIFVPIIGAVAGYI